jgi:hypothetical protein
MQAAVFDDTNFSGFCQEQAVVEPFRAACKASTIGLSHRPSDGLQQT